MTRKSRSTTSPSLQTEARNQRTCTVKACQMESGGQAGIYKFDKERMEQNEGRNLAKFADSQSSKCSRDVGRWSRPGSHWRVGHEVPPLSCRGRVHSPACLQRTKSFAGAADADDVPSSSSRRNAPVEFEREDAEPRRSLGVSAMGSLFLLSLHGQGTRSGQCSRQPCAKMGAESDGNSGVSPMTNKGRARSRSPRRSRDAEN